MKLARIINMLVRQPLLVVAISISTIIKCYSDEANSISLQVDSLKQAIVSAEYKQQVDLLNALAYNFYYLDVDSTQKYAESALLLADSLNYARGLSEAQRLMGIAAKAQNKDKEAFRWLYQGLETAQSIDYHQGIADNLNSIGVFFSYVEDHRRALDYFRKSARRQIMAGNNLREGILYANLGNSFLKIGNLDSSEFYYQKSRILLDSIGNDQWRSMVYSQYAALLIELGQLNLALSYSESALDLSQKENQPFHMRKSYQNLAEIYLQRGEYDKAQEMARKALTTSQDIGFIPYLVESNFALYQIEKAKNNVQAALQYHETYSQYRDSLRFDQMRSESDLLQFELALDQKERENSLLRQENETKEAMNRMRGLIIHRQNLFGAGITITLIVVSALAVILFRLRRKEHDANKKLLQSNTDLEEQKEELTATLQMVEHLNAQLQAQNNALNRSAIVSFTDLQGNIISVNDNFCDVSGYRRDELIGQGKRLLKSGEHPRSMYKEMWESITSGLSWRGELKNKKKDGSYFWVDTSIAPVMDDNGKPKQFFSLQFEITERKNYLEEISHKTDELEELNQLKDRLLSIVSHDFRSPLNSLQGTLNLLLNGAISEDEFKMLTRDLVLKLDHTYNLLENLLSWAKTQMQGIKVYPKMIDLKAIVNDCIDLLKPLASKKLVNIHNHLQEPLKVYADNEMVKLVLRNLLSNSIKFSNARSEIEVFVSHENNHALISVKDQGIGISNENQSKLFKYESFSTFGTSNEKGMGIGLLLCKEFIEQNGGNLYFESEFGKGSVFSFSLPTVEVEAKEYQA